MSFEYKVTPRDLPKVEGKPKPIGHIICDAIYDAGQHKMFVQFRDSISNEVIAKGIVAEPLTFCDVIDKFRSRNG